MWLMLSSFGIIVLTAPTERRSRNDNGSLPPRKAIRPMGGRAPRARVDGSRMEMRLTRYIAGGPAGAVTFHI